MAMRASLSRIVRKILGRPEPTPPKPFNHARNPYKARRPWPPNLSKLPHIHQFRLEKRYRKRLAMKYLTPRWMKWTNILRWGSIVGFLVYAFLFYDFTKDPMNPSGEEPFQPLRDKVFGTLNMLWTPAPERHTLYKEGIKKSEPKEPQK